MAKVAVLSAVRERFAHLSSDEVTGQKYSESFKENVRQLNSKFIVIENFLKKKKNCSEENSSDREHLVNQAIQLAYDAEDAVEYLVLQQDASATSSKSKPHGGSIKFKGFLKFAPSPKSHQQDIDFQSVNERIDKLIKHCGGEDAAESGGGDAIRFPSVVDLPENKLVGMEEDFDKLQYLLLNNDDRYPLVANAISLVGAGGIGKTTLARKLFEDPSVVMKFDCRAWAHVGQNFKARDTATTILVDLTGSTKEEIQKMETTELMGQLYEAQKGRRCLVVLDDLGSLYAWDTMRFAFASEQGTRIVITTHILDVAKHANGYIHQMKFLNEELSWDLFKIHSGMQDAVSIAPNQETEVNRKKIAGHCRGIPLAITVFGSMVRAWKLDLAEPLHMLEDDQSNSSESLLAILTLSYDHLPFKLKPCFLYLGFFPSELVIPVEKLYLLWMAEGLISTPPEQEFKTRMDTARDYLLALVQTSLVVLHHEDFSGTQKFKSCELHDLIYDLCIVMGDKEGYFRVVNSEQRKKNSCMHRIAIPIDTHEGDDNPLKISEPKRIRSLLFFGTDGSPSQSAWPAEVADLKEFRSTRVLDFDGVTFQYRKLPKGIDKLLFLRYLSFNGCYLEVLPPSFNNFPYLETLDLRVRTSCKMIIPNILWKMSSLLHLYFPITFQSPTNEKLKLDSLMKLEILENFHAGLCDADDLQKLRNLKILKGIADGNNEDLNKLINFINGNSRLYNSSLVVKNFDCYTTERKEILKKLLNCDPLHALDIEGHLGDLQVHEAFGLHFTEMVFKGTEFHEDVMPILGKLPNLRNLVLCNDAFVGKKMECSEGDFPNLKSLELSNLWSLEEWVVESGAMPCFSSLTVEQCPKLDTLPDELMEKENLEVKIKQMPKVFQERVRGMAEEQRDSGNEVVVRRL